MNCRFFFNCQSCQNQKKKKNPYSKIRVQSLLLNCLEETNLRIDQDWPKTRRDQIRRNRPGLNMTDISHTCSLKLTIRRSMRSDPSPAGSMVLNDDLGPA